MSIDNALAEDYKDVSYKRTSVHDPSVVIDTITNEETCTYYIFGSHMAVSKSTDLVNWTYVTGESTSSKLFGKMNGDAVQTCSYDEAYLDNVVKKVKNYKGEEVDFGTYNIPEWQGAVNNFTIRGNQWAPDVVYNKTMKKWLMYMSLNGDDWNSAIVCLASDNIEGPYVYQGPVIFSGFTGKKTSSHQDFHKSDLEIAIGEQSALPSRYNRNSSWGTYLPHAIDPCVFYDEEGNLKLSYGSWSGGIYLIDLDENTGLRDYTVNYAAVNAGTADVTIDPYFGKKIAGGWYVSGEGSYIEHIGKYYYLFMSYGFYSPDGGYEMRVFRADNPEGPYVDTKGTNAIFSGKYEMNYGTTASGTTGNRGVKLMGNYKWDTMPVAEISQGHNSAMTDKDGRSFVIYHTKFNDGTDGHSVRVHQLFQNEDGWLVASPYEFAGEKVTQNEIESSQLYSISEIAGTYQFIAHKYKVNYKNYENQTPVNIILTEDGKIESNDGYSGSWSLKEGTSFITLNINNVVYKGVLTRQTIDYTDISALCFTAVCSSGGVAGTTQGLEIWGSKADAKSAISYTLKNLNIPITDGTSVCANLSLPTKGLLGTTVSWKSSDEDVLKSDDGTAVANGKTNLTLVISKDEESYSKQYQVVVNFNIRKNFTDVIGYYRFEDGFVNSANTSQTGVASAQASASKPSIVSDATRQSNVLKLNFGYDSASTSNYVEFPNPLFGADVSNGVTVSMFVNRTAANSFDAIWAFKDNKGAAGRIYMTPNVYLGYNGTYGYYDVNHPDKATNSLLGVNEWHLLTATFADNGFSIYIDGILKFTQSNNLAFASTCTDFKSSKNIFSDSDVFYLGYGSWWGTAPVMIDDICIFNKALSDEEVAQLYSIQQNVKNDLTTGIRRQKRDEKSLADGEIFDIQGRKRERPQNGIYILNGHKVFISTK